MARPPKHFLSLADIPASELKNILKEAHRRKKNRGSKPKGALDDDAPLAGHTLAMLFEKSSTRTRFSFDMGMRQLGGSSIVSSSADMQLGRGETIEDTGRVLSRYVDAIMLRANSHEAMVTLAHNSTVPVINGLSDYNHPCQILADLQTLEEQGRDLNGLRLTWVGDGNNVAVSFINAAVKFGFHLTVSCPQAYGPNGQDITRAISQGAEIVIEADPMQACKNADVVIADTFVSMGDKDTDARLKDLMPWQVSDELMSAANNDALFLHCLPAHRGEEVAASVIDGPQSIVFDEAENRLHAQKAILMWCLDV